MIEQIERAKSALWSLGQYIDDDNSNYWWAEAVDAIDKLNNEEALLRELASKLGYELKDPHE